jgi:hypothetical protein
MKNVLFIVCFSLGVTLMIFSGYLPQPASARAAGSGLGTDSGSRSAALFGQEFAGTVTRKAPPGAPPPADETVPSAEVPESPVFVEEPADSLPAEVPVSEAGAELAPTSTAQADVAPLDTGSAEIRSFDPPPVAPPVVSSDPPAPLPPVEAAPSLPPESRVVADAGGPRVVWVGWDEITLDGSASVGDRLVYQWRQTGGPSWLTIQADDRPITTATGLLGDGPPSWRNRTYQFELTVMDVDGRDATAGVQYVVKSAPSLKIKPTAERRFELRDGYWLAHFTSWATNLESYEQVFDLFAERELRFTKVAGGEFELTGGKAESGFAYQVIVYGQAGEPNSWVEFLVDTDEKIPGVVQLGVNWETR